MMMTTMTIVMTVWYACGCEAHWSQRSEGLTEQTMELDFHRDDDDDDGDDDYEGYDMILMMRVMI